MLTKSLNTLIVKNAAGKYTVDNKQGFKVIFNDFGDSSVDLYVTCWILVEEKATVVANIKEIIYNTLNKNNIEIPFPQQDIYIRHVETSTPSIPTEVVETNEQPEPAQNKEPKKQNNRKPRKPKDAPVKPKAESDVSGQ